MTKLEPIPNFSMYMANKEGGIYSRYISGYLRQYLRKDGYLQVTMFDDDGIRKTIGSHIVIAKAFLSNPNVLGQVHHKNDLRDDNRSVNLQWVTQEDNLKMKWR